MIVGEEPSRELPRASAPVFPVTNSQGAGGRAIKYWCASELVERPQVSAEGTQPYRGDYRPGEDSRGELDIQARN